MIAVGWTGIYAQWTPNNVALGIVMVGAAWLATKIVSALPTLWRIFRKLLARAFGQRRVSLSQPAAPCCCTCGSPPPVNRVHKKCLADYGLRFGDKRR